MFPIRTLKRFRERLLFSVIAIAALGLLVTPAHAAASDADRTLPNLIQQQIDAGKKKIVVPPGQYRVEPRNRIHLVLRGLRGVEIDATGAELICTQTTRAISIEDCEDLTIRGLTIDYDPLPFTQGRIVAISDDRRVHTIDLFDGYPRASTVTDKKYEIYDEETDELLAGSYHNFKVEVVNESRIIVTKPRQYRPEHAAEDVGDLIVIASENAPGGSIPHAIVANESKGLVFEGVSLYASNSFGYFETYCDGSVYRDCIADRRASSDDLKPRAHRRLRSLNADGFHSKFATKGPAYLNCIARYMGDDGVAINGHYHLILQNDGDRIQVLDKFGRTPNFSAGDELELVSFTGVRIPNASVVSVQPGPAPTAEQKALIQGLNMRPVLKTQMLEASATLELVIDRSTDLPPASLIAAADRLGNGFTVSGCTLGPNRSRGMVVKASDGTITNNTLVDNHGHGIMVAPAFWWLEAGSASNLTISGNQISGCLDVGIAVYSNGGDGSISPAGALNNISITNNAIRDSANPAIGVTSTKGLTLESNSILAPLSFEVISPFHRRKMGRAEDRTRQVYLENVER